MTTVAALDICGTVAFRFGVAPACLSWAKRTEIWTHADDARAIAIWLIRHRTSMRHIQIATLFDIRRPVAYSVIDSIDHDTSCRIRSDPLLRQTVAEIQSELDETARFRAETLGAALAA